MKARRINVLRIAIGLGLALLVFGTAAALFGCGGGTTTTTAAPPDTNAPVTTAAPETTTTAAALPGTGKKIGFTNPLAANEQLMMLQNSIKARVELLGYEFVPVDDQLNVDKQIADIDQLVAQKVDGIIVFPLDAKSVGPAVERAKAAGVKVVGINVNMEQLDGDIGNFDAQVVQGVVQQADEAAELIAKELGGKGDVLAIGIGVPVPTIMVQVAEFQTKAKSLGLNILAQVDNPTDDAAGAQVLVEQAMARFPNIDAVYAYNDPSALGAYSALSGAGKTAVITGSNGSSDGIQGVKDGKIIATWDLEPVLQGVTMANVTNELITGGTGASKLVPVTMYDKSNIDSRPGWDAQLEQVKSGQLTE